MQPLHDRKLQLSRSPLLSELARGWGRALRKSARDLPGLREKWRIENGELKIEDGKRIEWHWQSSIEIQPVSLADLSAISLAEADPLWAETIVNRIFVAGLKGLAQF
jgi:hypothetical protein